MKRLHALEVAWAGYRLPPRMCITLMWYIYLVNQSNIFMYLVHIVHSSISLVSYIHLENSAEASQPAAMQYCIQCWETMRMSTQNREDLQHYGLQAHPPETEACYYPMCAAKLSYRARYNQYTAAPHQPSRSQKLHL